MLTLNKRERFCIHVSSELQYKILELIVDFSINLPYVAVAGDGTAAVRAWAAVRRRAGRAQANGAGGRAYRGGGQQTLACQDCRAAAEAVGTVHRARGAGNAGGTNCHRLGPVCPYHHRRHWAAGDPT